MFEELGKKLSDKDFFENTAEKALDAGKEVIEKVLILYYAAEDPNTPIWAKTTILSSIAYFIFPQDAIPDYIPVAGYADDLAVLCGALAVVAVHINKKHKRQAREKMKELFDDVDEKD